jgi:hypothetical protein
MSQETEITIQKPVAGPGSYFYGRRRRRSVVDTDSLLNNYQPSKEGLDGMDYNEINLEDVETPEKK